MSAFPKPYGATLYGEELILTKDGITYPAASLFS